MLILIKYLLFETCKPTWFDDNSNLLANKAETTNHQSKIINQFTKLIIELNIYVYSQ